jgi:hypothetical protein
MASPLYTKLVKTVGEYTGPEKAAGAIDRRLKECNATPDTFSADHLKSILDKVIAVATLYITEADKQAALTVKLKQLVA